MAVHPAVKNVLVIGAGDGGVIRELTRYPEIEHIDLVEIDELVVEVCKKYLPKTSCRLDDPRLSIHYEDGVRFVRSCEDKYDLIIVDSTDPFGPGEGLFTKEFYGNCYKALKEDGIMVNQHESPFYDEDAAAMQRAHKRIVESFAISKVYQAHIPTYPSGHWLFGFASKKYHPVKDLNAAVWNLLGIHTQYYNTRLHAGAFALPSYVEGLLKDVEPNVETFLGCDAAFEDAGIVLFGAPFDSTTSFRPGTRFASKAMRSESLAWKPTARIWIRI